MSLVFLHSKLLIYFILSPVVICICFILIFLESQCFAKGFHLLNMSKYLEGGVLEIMNK